MTISMQLTVFPMLGNFFLVRCLLYKDDMVIDDRIYLNHAEVHTYYALYFGCWHQHEQPLPPT